MKISPQKELTTILIFFRLFTWTFSTLQTFLQSQPTLAVNQTLDLWELLKDFHRLARFSLIFKWYLVAYASEKTLELCINFYRLQICMAHESFNPPRKVCKQRFNAKNFLFPLFKYVNAKFGLQVIKFLQKSPNAFWTVSNSCLFLISRLNSGK